MPQDAQFDLVNEARKIADAIELWCDDPTASAVILGSISARLSALCQEAGRRAGYIQPYVEEADANPERRDNGAMIYRTGA